MSTLSALQSQVALAIADPNHYEISTANLTSLINESMRDIIKDAKLNKAQILIKVALVGAVITPTLTKWSHAVIPAPTLAITDWNGVPVLEIPDVLIMHGVTRYTAPDGKRTIIDQVSEEMIERLDLMETGGDRIAGYKVIDAPVFRIALYPPLATSAYPFYLDIPYLRIPVNLSGASDVPEIPVIYHDLIAARAIYRCHKATGKVDKMTMAERDYLRDLNTAIGQMGSDDIKPTITRRRRRLC